MKNIFIANSNFLSKFLNLLFFILLLDGCTNSSNSNSSEDKVFVTGQITYDRVLDTEGGLDYTSITPMPVRRALVSAVDASSGSIIENTYSDEFGNYSFSIGVPKTIKISVYSQSQNPLIRIQDNFTFEDNEFARYVMQSSSFTTSKGVNIQKDLNADSGFDSTTRKLENMRVAAPFAILDNCLQASDFFLKERSIDFPKLIVNWSEKNSTSTINTSNWTGTELYILGDADQDTDEYDQHVIIHEWGHYFESMIGRSDSIGGRHTDGDVLDPRVAFSEGWGNAFSAMVLYPDSVYKDTGGLNQGTTGIKFDVEENNYELSKDSEFKIGWFSENSVQSILYDLFDPESSETPESWDLLSSNAGTIYDIFASDLKDSDSLVTIYTFINSFNVRNPSLIDDVNILLEKHSIDPIIDDLGSDETNDGGVSGSLPVYKTLTLDSQIVLDFQLAKSSNMLANIQYIKISGVSGNADISATGNSSKKISLSYKGELLSSASGLSDISIENFNFEETKSYILLITNGLSPTQITISLTKRN